MMIYDCFTFFNELDILEIRLRELYDVVDRFVLVEATHAHKGDSKPLHFAANRQRFAQYGDKIIHIVAGDLPEGEGAAAIWRREMTQRQCILRGLLEAKDNDVVLVSDVDEIPRRSCIPRELPDDVVLTYDQTLYYYNVNTRCTNLRWRGTRAATAANVRALTPDGLRWCVMPRGDYPRLLIAENAGWHFSYFGNAEHIRTKMRSFLHQELVNEETLAKVEERRFFGVDAYGRDDQKFELVRADDLPIAIKIDPQRWNQYFHPDMLPRFNEDWFTPEQSYFVGWLASQSPKDGEIVEIGCWEGRSTISLAQSVAPRIVHTVDHWQGNIEEGLDHPSVTIEPFRDVFRTFEYHIEALTQGNVSIHRQDWREWIKDWNKPISFLHLDAAHDYNSVFDCLEAIKPLLVQNAILCGDDYYDCEVYQAVKDSLGDKVNEVGGRMWVYQHGN